MSPILGLLISRKALQSFMGWLFLIDGNDNPRCKTEKETQVYRTDLWTLWEKARVGWSERTALKQVYYQGWNRSPAQVGCMRQVLRAGALGWPRGMGWGGRQEGGSGCGTHVNPWLSHVNVWQKPLQHCKVISLQLIKISGKKKVLCEKKKKLLKKHVLVRLIVCTLPSPKSHIYCPSPLH